jgi:predicted ATPase/class 3 adenylate cyclase
MQRRLDHVAQGIDAWLALGATGSVAVTSQRTNARDASEIHAYDRRVARHGSREEWAVQPVQPVQEVARAPSAAWFLFTDLEDSARLWDRDPQAMELALARHDELLNGAVASVDGRVVKHTGDGLLAVFPAASNAVQGAVEVQRRVSFETWPTDERLRVRVGIHGGPSDSPDDGWFTRGDDFVGPALHRCARLMAAAHGGQIVCSQAVVDAAQPCTDVTFDDLGNHVLRGLARHERVHQVVHAALLSSFPPLRSLETVPGNLPTTEDPLVGRDRELTDVAMLVRRHRLVTLTGVGGVGKTRLALHVAETVSDEFPDGVWLVALASVADPELVPSTVARVLGVRERAGPPVAALADALGDRRLLLLLDNCEHVIDAVARLAGELVTAAPGVRILATSRETLDVPGEQAWPVPVLEVPHPGATALEALSTPAVQLLRERARAAMGGVELDDEDIEAIADLCRRLDGIPLALELAAVRLYAMTPREVVDRLDRRFQLLGRRRDQSGRHETLRNTIDWSHELLDLDEKTLFRRLSVFAGGFGVAAAEGVVAGGIVDELDVATVLGRLVRKSMVVVERTGQRSRFRLLETLRDYATERLEEAGERDVFRDAHRDHFVRLVESRAGDLRGPGQADAYEELLRELDNVRAAFDRTVDAGRGEQALHLVRILRTFWAELLPSEGLQRARAAVAIARDAPAVLLAGGLADVSWIGYVGSNDDAAAAARQSIDVSRSAGAPADPEAHFTLALVALFDRDLDGSLREFDEGARIAREIDDPYELSAALVGCSLVRSMLGDQERALAEGEEALVIGRELGYDTQIAASLAALGFAHGMTDPARALELLEGSFAIKDDTTYSAIAMVVAGHLHVVLGHVEAALGLFARSLRFYVELGDDFLVPTNLEGIAGALCLGGRAEAAGRVLGMADMAREKLGLPGLEVELALRAVVESLAAQALGERLEQLRVVGREQPLLEGIGQTLQVIDDVLGVDARA